MDIKTEPYIEELVTDLVIGFPSGVMKDFVLKTGDTFDSTDKSIIVVIANPKFPERAETIVFHKVHVAWYSMMERTIRRVAPKPDGTVVAPE